MYKQEEERAEWEGSILILRGALIILIRINWLRGRWQFDPVSHNSFSFKFLFPAPGDDGYGGIIPSPKQGFSSTLIPTDKSSGFRKLQE